MKKQSILFIILLLSLYPINTFASQNRRLLDANKKGLASQDSSENIKSKPLVFVDITTGIIANKTFGMHAILNISYGIRRLNNYYNLVYEHRFGDSKSYYQIFKNDTLKSINLYNASYLGFEYKRIILRNQYHKLYPLIGVGYDWISLHKEDNTIEGELLDGVAVNIGFGYTYFIKKKHGINIELINHFVHMTNENGTKINPNSLLMRLSYHFGNK